MPNVVDLSGTRGDELLFAVPLTAPGPPVRPLTLSEAQGIKAAWPTIHMQVRARPGAASVAIDLTSAAGELSIEPAHPQPDGTTAPALLIRVPATKSGTVLSGVYDVQFSGPGSGPLTWVRGAFVLEQDVTDATP